jgi:hypothetical protein
VSIGRPEHGSIKSAQYPLDLIFAQISLARSINYKIKNKIYKHIKDMMNITVYQNKI